MIELCVWEDRQRTNDADERCERIRCTVETNPRGCDGGPKMKNARIQIDNFK